MKKHRPFALALLAVFAAEAATARGGMVVVSYVIDETGAVRVPIAERAIDPAATEAALALVREWRYEAPTVDGAPVLAEAREAVIFEPREAAP